MSGWIKINRDLRNHWCASDPNFLAVWFHLLSSANWQDKKTLINGKLVTVKRGQLIFGLNAWSDKTGVSVKRLRRIIDVFLDDGMLGKQNFSKYSIISITNWEEYQVEGKQGAGTGQAEGRQRATLKEDKKGKEGEEKKHIYDETFLKFWEVYPKKTAKLESEKVFLRQCKKFKSDDILEGAKKFALSCKGKDPQYIPYPATWLNGGRWADDYEPPKKQHSELPEDFGVADGEEITLMEGF